MKGQAPFLPHVHDGISMPDLEGSEFGSLTEVAQAVRDSLSEMIADASLERNAVAIAIEVRDEQGWLVVGGSVDYALDMMPMLSATSIGQLKSDLVDA